VPAEKPRFAAKNKWFTHRHIERFKTTLGSINLANQVNQVADRYVVPGVLKGRREPAVDSA